MTIKYFIQACMLILSPASNAISFADDVKYRVEDIPKPLLKYAKAVVRNAEIPVEIKPKNNLVQKVKCAITLLNRNGAIGPGHFEYSYSVESCRRLNCKIELPKICFT